MNDVLFIMLGLWSLSAFVLAFFRLGVRSTSALLQIVLASLLALSVWGLPLMRSGSLQLPIWEQSIDLVFSARILSPVVFMAILLQFIVGGRSSVASLLASQSIALLLVGFALPLLIGIGQVSRALFGFGQSLLLLEGSFRIQLAEAASLLAGLYLLIILYQAIRIEFRNLWRFIAACGALLGAGLVQGALSATGASWGSPFWLQNVTAEALGWSLATLGLAPAIAISLRLVADEQVADQPGFQWRLPKLLRETFTFEQALRRSESRIVELNEQLTLITDLRRVIVRAGDQNELLNRFTERLVQSSAYSCCWIGVRGFPGQELAVVSAAGSHWSDWEGPGLEGETASAEFDWQLNAPYKPSALIDIAQDHPFHESARQAGHRSWRLLPLMAENEAVGIVAIYGKEDEFSGDKDLLLAGIAEDLSYGLRRLQLQHQRSQKVRELDVVREVMNEFIAEHEVSKLLDLVIERAVNLMDADGGEIYLVRGGQQELTPAITYGQVHGSKDLAESLLNTPQSTGRSQLSSASGASVTTLSTLLRWRDQVNGVINLYRGGQRPFSPRDQDLLELFANQAALAIENARLIEAERQRSEELEILRQASLSMTSSLEFRAVLEAILRQCLRAVEAHDAHIFTFDGEELHFGAALWADGIKKDPYSNPRPEGLTYSVARSGERIVVERSSTHPFYAGTGWGWDGAIVGMPLMVRSRVLGVMNVAFNEPHHFSKQELHVLQLLADQAALVLENSRLFERTVAEQRRLRLLFDVAKELATSMDPDQLLQQAIETTTKQLGGLIGSIVRADQDSGEMEIVALAGMPLDMIDYLNEEIQLKVGQGIVGWVAETKQPTLSEDVTVDERWIGIPGVDDQTSSAIAAPIPLGDEVGILAIFHTELAVFNSEHVELLVAIGQQLSLAWSNATRYRQVERRLAEQTVIQQVAQVINSRLEMEELLESVVEQVSSVLGYPVVDITLIEGEELVMRARRAPRDADEFRMHFGEGIVGRVVASGDPELVADVRQDPDYVELEPDTRSEIAVPLHKGDVIIGVLNVESPTPNGLGEDDLRLLTLLADQISVAIENAALYDRLRDHTQDLEEAVELRTNELREALDRAREADRLKTQFVSDVSHELRTPLSNIRLYVELLSQAGEENFQEYLGTLGRETERLVTLIEDLLSISRLDAKSVPFSPKKLDLNAISKSLVEDRRRLFSDRSLELNFEPHETKAMVFADEKLLSQVIANLMTNAMHYTPAGGKVELRTDLDADGDWVRLEVSDTGLGIKKAEQELLFARFFRGSASRTMGNPGTGLGLAICQEIMERHNGKITVKSEEGEGSHFTLWLPSAVVAGKEEAPALAEGA